MTSAGLRGKITLKNLMRDDYALIQRFLIISFRAIRVDFKKNPLTDKCS
jgi:hypothetical protein